VAVLLLQGPLGSFFKHFSDQLSQAGETVYKINFNGGDEFYAQSENSVAYTGKPKDWSVFLTRFIELNNIQTVFAYGDCRFYHHKAKRICINHDVRYFAFEEGYLRPNYITLEEGGVNGHSPLASEDGHKAIEAYAPVHAVKNEEKISGNFLQRTLFAMTYDLAAFIGGLKFPHYQRHRNSNPIYNGLCWARGFFRKALYRLTEKNANQIAQQGEFYLVPLQVFNDAQIEFHSDYKSMEAFISEVIMSFSASQKACNLVIKHHPMDRGFVNYSTLIKRLAAEQGLSGRVFYIHDQHLPTLLKKCLGVVTINSTTALQAFYHSAPVKVMGDSFFDMPGLTHQSELASFWLKPEALDTEFADRFKGYLLDHGQINGSFYCDADISFNHLMPYLKKQGVIAS
jgi:capsular polysaccharide export protein